MPEEKTFGTELRRLRRDAGLNLADLADAAGCSITFISEVERGRKNPPDPATIGKLLVRMGQESCYREMLVLAARARRSVEISTEGKSQEEADVLVALARSSDEGTLDPEILNEIRKLLEKRKAP